jgi:hypothetical protein
LGKPARRSAASGPAPRGKPTLRRRSVAWQSLERSGCDVRAAAGLAVRAQTPERDLGLVHLEAVFRAWVQAWPISDGAVDVLDRATTAADDVVVVVADPGFEAGRAAGRLDPAGQPGA